MVVAFKKNFQLKIFGLNFNIALTWIRLVDWLAVFRILSTVRSFRDAPPTFTAPNKGREARFLHRSYWNTNQGRRVAVHYTIAAPRQLPINMGYSNGVQGYSRTMI